MRKTSQMRSTGKDKVREASRRLRVILKTSRKLSVKSEDMEGLRAVTLLRTSCQGSREPSLLLFLAIVLLGAIVSAGILFLASGLQDTHACKNTTTDEVLIQTVRLDRLSLDGSREQSEDATLFNDSEDMEDSRLRTSRVRLQER